MAMADDDVEQVDYSGGNHSVFLFVTINFFIRWQKRLTISTLV